MTPAQRRFTAKRFLGMLEHKRPTCDCCPFQRGFTAHNVRGFLPGRDWDEWCQLCCEAMDIDSGWLPCPCQRYGEHEAVKRAWLFIEDSGILEAHHEVHI